MPFWQGILKVLQPSDPRTAHQAPDDPVVVDAEAVPYLQIEVRFEANALLDLLVFYDRLYLASDGGLLSIDPFDPEDPSRLLRPNQRVADPCYSAAGGLGAVAASCGPEGLRILLDDQRWAGTGRAARKVASESIRAEVGAGTVVNHRSRSDFEFSPAQLRTRSAAVA